MATETELEKPPVAAAVADTAPKEEKLTKEQGDLATHFVSKLFGAPPPKVEKKEPTPEEAEAARVTEEKAAAEKAKGDKPKPKPKPAAKVAPVAAAPDYEKIAEASARGVATALETAKPKEPEKVKTDELGFLSTDEKEEYEIIARMAKDMPDRYKGLPEKYATSIKNLQAYQAEWEKENPGKEFDPEDEAHNEFYAKNEVDWEDRHYAKAVANMATDEVKTKLTQKEQQEQSERAAARKHQEVEPLAQKGAKAAANTLFSAIGKGFEKVLDPNGVASPEQVKALFAEDEVTAQEVFSAATALEAKSAEMVRLHNGSVSYNEKNPTHVELATYAGRQEAEMLALPAEQQVDSEGRQFATAAKYNAMTKEERARHWRYSAGDLNALMAADMTQMVKNRLEADQKRIDALAPKRGWSKTNGEQAKPAPEPKPAARAATERELKPNSPAGGDEPLVAGRAPGGKVQAPSLEKHFVKRLMGG